MNVLIIGGSSDIGIDIANYLKSNGYRVMITYNKHQVEVDDDILTIWCDVKNEESVLKVFEYGINEFGRIDILINLASISMDNSFLNKTVNEFKEVLEVNLVGMFLCNQIYSRYFNDGLIINMGSTDGINTSGIYSIDYAASKAGIICMSKIIARATSNRIVCLCPNWIDSNSTRDMDDDYLKSELVRIGQSRLITLNEVSQCIKMIIESQIISGSIYKLDIRDDKLWLEKI